MRTTLDLTDEAYYVAKSMAREEGRSLGRVVSDLITLTREVPVEAILGGEADLPVFRCVRRVTSDDVKAF